MTVIEAITEEQINIIAKAENPTYSLDDSISDIDLIADLTELKLNIRAKKK